MTNYLVSVIGDCITIQASSAIEAEQKAIKMGYSVDKVIEI